MHTHQQLLDLIRKLGSVSAAAESLQISKQSISKRFVRLPDDDPLKVEYKSLVKSGRNRKWADDRERWRENKRKQRSKSGN